MDPALLPLCPMGCLTGRRGKGSRGKQEGQQWLLVPGTLAEAWAPLLPSFLLNLPVYLSPMEISSGFACVGFGLFLPLDRAEARLGRLLLQQVKL